MDRSIPARDIVRALKLHETTKKNPRQASVRAAVGEVSIGGDYAQFGVYRGVTARVIDSLMTGERKLHLFDSFEGLPEDWIARKKKGDFRVDPARIPKFDPGRVVVHKGWFKDTVPGWAREATVPLAFVHLDADLYSSTVDALFNIDHLILKGTVLLLDEYMRGGSDDEHRAMLDWCEKFGRECEYLWRSQSSHVCVRVIR